MSDTNEEWMPLTLPQLDFWEEFTFHPDLPVSTVAHCLEIRGEVREEALIRAIEQTVSEADVLALRFREQDNPKGLFQRYEVQGRPELELMDLRQETDPMKAAEDVMDHDMQQNLNLRVQYLSRLILLRLSEQHYLFYIRAHHIVIDGYGFALIEQRCGQLYSHFCGQGEAGHPFNSFRSFLQEEEAYRNSRRWEKDRSYWANYLDPSVSLPVLNKGVEDYGVSGLHAHGAFPDSFGERLQKMAQELDTGWPDLLILLSGLYLSRTLSREEGGGDAITLWLPFMSRWGSVGAHMPALMVNILPFQLQYSPQQSIRSFLSEAVATLREQRKHGRYRIEQIAADHGMKKGNRFFFTPLVNVLPFNSSEFFGCEVSRRVLANGSEDGFNLTFRGETDGSGLVFYVDADPAMTRQDSFERHQKDLPSFLLEALAVEALDRTVGELWNGFSRV